MRTLHILAVISFLAIAWSAIGFAQDGASAAGQNNPSGERNGNEQLSVRIDGGRLTAIVQNYSLRQALEEVAAQAHFTLIFAEGADERLESLDLKNKPHDEGLR
jgi:hypothetical protein